MHGAWQGHELFEAWHPWGKAPTNGLLVACAKSQRRQRAPRLDICCLCSSMVLCLSASWGGCGGGLAARVPSLKELMALPCTMQSCRLKKKRGRAPHVFMCTEAGNHSSHVMGLCIGRWTGVETVEWVLAVYEQLKQCSHRQH